MKILGGLTASLLAGAATAAPQQFSRSEKVLMEHTIIDLHGAAGSHPDSVHAPTKYSLDFLGEVSRLLRNAFPKEAGTILNHGCWCGSFNENHSNQENLGGQIAVDRLDELCRDWAKARFRSDRHQHGTCRRAKADKRKNHYMLDLKKKVYLSTCLPGVSVGNKKLSKCEKEDCEIDRKYLSLIGFYLTLNPNAGGNLVLDDETCVSNHML